MAEPEKRRSLGQILTGFGIISEQQLDEALAAQKDSGLRLGEQLQEMEFCDTGDVEWALSTQLELPLVRVTLEMVDRDAASLVPPGLARAGCLIPIWAVGDDVGIVMADPTNQQVKDAVAEATGKEAQFSLGIPSEIRGVINEIFGDAPEGDGQSVFGLYDTDLFGKEDARTINLDASGKAFLERLFAEAVLAGANAVFFERRSGAFSIRFRIGSEVRTVVTCQVDWYDQLTQKLDVMANLRETGQFGIRQGRLFPEIADTQIRTGFEVTSAPAGRHVTVTCRPMRRLRTTPDLATIDFGESANLLEAATADPDSAFVVAASDTGFHGWLMRALLNGLNNDQRRTIAIAREREIADERVEDRTYTVIDPGEQRPTTEQILEQVLALEPNLLLIDAPWNQADREVIRFLQLQHVQVIQARYSENAATLARELAETALAAPGSDTLALSGLVIPAICDSCRQEISGVEIPGVKPDITLFEASGCKECDYTGSSGNEFVAQAISIDQADGAGDALASRLTEYLEQGRIAAADYMLLLAKRTG